VKVWESDICPPIRISIALLVVQSDRLFQGYGTPIQYIFRFSHHQIVFLISIIPSLIVAVLNTPLHLLEAGQLRVIAKPIEHRGYHPGLHSSDRYSDAISLAST
jgi:hypothetical protein